MSNDNDQHHDIFEELDFEGIERGEDETSDEVESQKSPILQPILTKFRDRFLFETLVDCIENCGVEKARDALRVDRACTIIIRSDKATLDVYEAEVKDIFQSGYRYDYVGQKPTKSSVSFFIFKPETKISAFGRALLESDLNTKLLKNNRNYILMERDDEFPADSQILVDAEIELHVTKAALITALAVNNLPPPSDDSLLDVFMQLSIASTANILSAPRSIFESVQIANRFVAAQKKAAAEEKKDTGPTLDDLHGLGAAGDWGRDLALDLADWKSDKISWTDLDRGILVSGAPGTGKTTFAAALARTCGVKLIATSMAQWQATGHLGDYLKAMRKSFDEARKSAPCILFIDEFDSAGDRNAQTDNNDYNTKAINGLLECLDGAAGREGVVVVGATNAPDKIDPALRRPGRLDKTVEIPLPDEAARDGILRFHLKQNLLGADLSVVVGRTAGMSGAWLEDVVRQARRAARRQRRELEVGDLIDALPEQVAIAPETLRIIATHEAGHAVVFLDNGLSLNSARISKHAEAASGSFAGGMVSAVQKNDSVYLRSKTENLDRVRQLLGGLAAEDLFFQQRSDGGTTDLKEATYILARMELATGQCDRLIYLADGDYDSVFAMLKVRPDIQKSVENTLQQCMSEAKAIVERRCEDVQKIAAALLKNECLTGDEIDKLLTPAQPKLRLLSRAQEQEDSYENHMIS
ncbi:AAA family ATPase [Pseudochrobactrum asaccharolyticum]|uniref:AAA family ATPase n=1 Tax=Pseudochrobactrum asaccharolyticum TaxID=354351 RepID=UPI004041C81C